MGKKMSNFEKAFEELGRIEGKNILTNRKDDLGGRTYWGISQKYHPSWPGWKVVDRYSNVLLSRKNTIIPDGLEAMVQTFYKKNFWDKCSLDGVSDFDIANEIFESYVNIGGKVRRWMQENLNLLNNKGSWWPEIAVDGKIGPQTLTTLSQALRRPKIKQRYLKLMNITQGAHYRSKALSVGSQEANLGGWLDQRVVLPTKL